MVGFAFSGIIPEDMLHNKSFVKKTKSGKVMKVGVSLIFGLITSFLPLIGTLHSLYLTIFLGFCYSWQQVREHYLRDDIYCGTSICKKCDSSVARLSASTAPILVLDTNVVLNQVILGRFCC